MQEATVSEKKHDHEVVAFKVSEQDFCFDLKSVREIRGWTETTILPHAQPYVKGVINLRGSVVPVVDLSERLGLGETEPGPRHVIIIAVVGEQTVGLLADVVSDILTVDDADMQPIPEIVDEVVRAYISGVLIADGRMIRKMNLSRVLPSTVKSAA
ncbi:Positive regulator of CheA protein activity (CheW) [Candidatus Rhodobacter oscarellae]|uniref:Positive regulator of CheA protein activity (CheW) n=1 Tax=Candidatus Rhodobacter oscarellae TaxID=1675527 RepID=A0A0J9EDC3_9RHOB|nr:chemotaxis protein CheW [Candidatus Rhodobacter lobularis]KMW60666.1 Positive regulator of CheA protein activity (CheW) [Candidatus Rhodobacter lobularis]